MKFFLVLLIVTILLAATFEAFGHEATLGCTSTPDSVSCNLSYPEPEPEPGPVPPAPTGSGGTLIWDPNNDTATLDRFRIYRDGEVFRTVWNESKTSVDVPSGCYTMTAVDIEERESDHSNEVCL